MSAQDRDAGRPEVGIVMGSASDLPIMHQAATVLDELGIPYEIDIVSAHRTPQRLVAYGETAEDRGLKAIVAGAGGAAHLPGMMAALTVVPVIGVPVNVTALKGMDALLSIAQMPAGIPVALWPAGIPVAPVASDNARNAGLLAAQIIGTASPSVRSKLREQRAEKARSVEQQAATVRAEGSLVTV